MNTRMCLRVIFQRGGAGLFFNILPDLNYTPGGMTSPQFSNDLMPGNGEIPLRGDRGLKMGLCFFSKYTN
jgi:hypothetical protein